MGFSTGQRQDRHLNPVSGARRGRPPPAQVAQRERFRLAQEYARNVLAEPCQRRVYAALAERVKRHPAKLLESDFLTPPVVELIELSGYVGRTGGTIRVIATDDIAVAFPSSRS